MPDDRRESRVATCRAKIGEMLEAHRGFGEIESFISSSRLSEEEGSALWLWAWSLRDPHDWRGGGVQAPVAGPTA